MGLTLSWLRPEDSGRAKLLFPNALPSFVVTRCCHPISEFRTSGDDAR